MIPRTDPMSKAILFVSCVKFRSDLCDSIEHLLTCEFWQNRFIWGLACRLPIGSIQLGLRSASCQFQWYIVEPSKYFRTTARNMLNAIESSNLRSQKIPESAMFSALSILNLGFNHNIVQPTKIYLVHDIRRYPIEIFHWWLIKI